MIAFVEVIEHDASNTAIPANLPAIGDGCRLPPRADGGCLAGIQERKTPSAFRT